KNHDSKPTSDHHQQPHHKASNSELLKSAKLVADAAQSHLRHEPSNYDKAKVAGAAANLLDAAGEYGKLDDKGLGKYLDQAEDYLRKYGSSSQQQHAGVGAGAHGGKTSPEKKKSEHGGGASDYVKMAQGFLHKEGSGGEGGGGGGGGGSKGDFMKMAGDFLKK
ncbi:hypothetical protein ABTP16_10385, partial [Acinetobacter baumannii]